MLPQSGAEIKSKDLPFPDWLQRGSVIWIRATVSRLQLGGTIRRLHARRGRGWNKAVGISSTAEAAEFLKRHETSRQQEVRLPTCLMETVGLLEMHVSKLQTLNVC
jgi:hypothetical protein